MLLIIYWTNAVVSLLFYVMQCTKGTQRQVLRLVRMTAVLPTVVCYTSCLVYVIQHRLLVASKSYHIHIYITTNICVSRQARCQGGIACEWEIGQLEGKLKQIGPQDFFLKLQCVYCHGQAPKLQQQIQENLTLWLDTENTF